MTEKQIQNEIMHYLSDKPLRIWRQNTGVARHNGRVVRYGIPGQADLSGILAGGVRLEIEVKTVKGRQSDAQKNWQKMIEKYGGVYILARSVDDVERYFMENNIL